MSSQQLTFYTHPNSPNSKRVHIALEEAKIPYTMYNVDLRNKPDWFAAKVNPIGKVPALSYGGPETSPEHPSDKSAKIAESLVCLEFLADLFPKSGLLPEDPVSRARVRFIISTFESGTHNAVNRVIFEGESTTVLLDELENFQRRLPEAGYAAGEWTIADAAVTPILALVWMLLEHDIGRYPVGEGKTAFATLENDPKFARLREYWVDVKTRRSFNVAGDEASMLEVWRKVPKVQRI